MANTQQTLADLIEQTSAYQLPSISKTNTLTSSFNNDLLDATEAQMKVEEDSAKEEATLYSQQLDKIFEEKKKQAKRLRDFLPKGAKQLKEWVESERKGNAIYDQHRQLQEEIDPISLPFTKQILTKSEWGRLNENDFAWDIRDSSNPVIPFFNEDEEAYNLAVNESKEIKKHLNSEVRAWEEGTQGELAPAELYFLLGKTPTGAEIDNKAVLFDGLEQMIPGDYQVEMSFVFPAGSITNAAGQELPRPMSYIDALTSTNQADMAWAPVLKQAMWSIHYARLNTKPGQEGIMDGLSDREIKNKIFKPWLEYVDKKQGTIVESQLEQRIKDSKTEKYTDFLSDLRSNGWDAALGPKYGFVSLNEVMADGTINNAKGFQELVNAFEWLENNDKISGQELYNYIHQPFTGRDGGQKFLQKEKPEVYSELNAIVQRGLRKEREQKALLQEQDIEDGYIEVANEIKIKVDNGETADPVLQEVITKKQRELADKYGLSYDDPKFSKYKALANKTGLADAFLAVDELNQAYAAGGRLPSDAINRLPAQIDLFGDGRYDRAYWDGVAKKTGAWGLTPSQLKEEEGRIEAIIKNLDRNRYDKNKGMDEKMINQKNAALDAFQANYDSLMFASASELTGKSKEQIDAIQDRNRVAAMETTKTQLEEGQFDARTTIPFPKKGEEEENFSLTEAGQRTQLFKELKGNKEEILNYPNYWPGEEAAINEYLKYKNDNTTGERQPHYYQWATPSSTPIKASLDDIIERRLQATAHLRDEKINVPPNDITNDNLTQEEKKDLCIFPSNAKTGQKICSSEEHAAWMLEALLDPKSEELGADTIYLQKTPRLQTDFSNELDQPLTQTPLLTLFEFTNSQVRKGNTKLKYGKYGLTTKQILRQIEAQELHTVEGLTFDDDTQNRIMLGVILDKANQDSACSTFDNSYRQITHLSKEEKEQFRVICSTSALAEFNKSFFNSPYNQLDVLMSEVALELSDMVLQE